MTELVRDDTGAVVGVHYEKDGQVHTEYGPGVCPARPPAKPA